MMVVKVILVQAGWSGRSINHRWTPDVPAWNKPPPTVFYVLSWSCEPLYYSKQTWRCIHSQCPAGRVFQHRVGSARVLDKIPGSGSGSGQVGVSKNTIGYFRVSFFLSGISGYFGYFRVCWVFSGISGFTHICYGYFLTLMRAEKIATKPNWL